MAWGQGHEQAARGKEQTAKGKKRGARGKRQEARGKRGERCGVEAKVVCGRNGWKAGGVAGGRFGGRYRGSYGSKGWGLAAWRAGTCLVLGAWFIAYRPVRWWLAVPIWLLALESCAAMWGRCRLSCPFAADCVGSPDPFPRDGGVTEGCRYGPREAALGVCRPRPESLRQTISNIGIKYLSWRASAPPWCGIEGPEIGG